MKRIRQKRIQYCAMLRPSHRGGRLKITARIFVLIGRAATLAAVVVVGCRVVGGILASSLSEHHTLHEQSPVAR